MIKKPMTFRADVDVLRGLAVALVVLYHLDFNFFQSGFVGVDIFFLISGYLITRIYTPDMSATEFYEKRLRRILPATLFVLFSFFLISPFFFLPFETLKITDTLIGTLLFAPNIIFWRDNDYFKDLDFSPLLHYWSLGVELQYYLVFPLILFVLKRRHALIATLAVFSFIACVATTNISAKTAFFMLPFRLWEFLLGYAAAHLCTRIEHWRMANHRLADGIAAASLAGLIASSILEIPKGTYPSAYALIPAGLSFTYILFGISEHLMGKKAILHVLYPFRWLAAISFSLYLVHYPIIFVAKYLPFSEKSQLSSWQQLACLVISLALSLLIYRLIEQPFRSKKIISTKIFKASMLAGYVLCIAVALAYAKLDYFIRSYEPDLQVILNAMTDRGEWRCSKLQKYSEPLADSCYLTKAEPSTKSIFLVGDSHIDVIKEIFTEVAISKNYSVRINKKRCFLGTNQCAFESVTREIEKYNISDVVMHGYAYESFNYDNLSLLNNWAAARGVRIHYIGPIPTYKVQIPKALYKEKQTKTDQIARTTWDEFTKSIPEQYIQFENKFKSEKNLYFYRPEEQICTPQCIIASEDLVYYFDSNHLTKTGSRILLPLVHQIYSQP